MSDDYITWTREKFEALPHRKFNESVICDLLVILPGKDLHDSGYRTMDAVAIKDGEPICLVAGGSDVIHIDGIGGFGKWENHLPKSIEPKGWNFDCLPGSGLLQIWPSNQNYQIEVGDALSSLEIFAVKVS